MAKIIIDGKGAVFGRLCSYAAKQALEGNEIVILNSERVVMTGNKTSNIAKYTQMRAKGGTTIKGPFTPRVAFMLLKRGIKRMLPDFRMGIGKEALSKIKCYNGVPKEFEKEKAIKVFEAKSGKYIELKELLERL